MGRMISFNRPDGKGLQGYLAEPKNAAGAPALVVIQEWWGLNDQIRGVADRFAEAGYRALVPDLYRGKSTVEAEEAHHLMTELNFGDAAGQDVRGAVQYLKGGGASKKCGVTGFCMGGALTTLSSVHVPEMDAGVIWYGYPPLEYVDAGKIKAPLMGHWATRDVPFPIAGVDALEAKLRGAGVKFEFHRYDCQHAFFNETQVGEKRLLPVIEYDPAAAALAWSRTLEFFGRHLRCACPPLLRR
jgi:carboxymethylenebutenolidase